MTTSKQILFRGDDAGSCPEANAAILQLLEAEAVRNVSVMACGPALDAFARRFVSRKGVSIGLHITLNSEWTTPKWGPVLPASSVPSLVDGEDYFLRTPQDSLNRGARLEEMTAEIKAQLQRLRSIGLDPQYVDEHMTVSWPRPELRQWIGDFARTEGLLDTEPLRRAPRVSERRPLESFANLAEMLRALPVGSYVLLSHPALLDISFVHDGIEGSWSMAAADRDRERQVLLDPRLPATLRANGISSISFGELGATALS